MLIRASSGSGGGGGIPKIYGYIQEYQSGTHSYSLGDSYDFIILGVYDATNWLSVQTYSTSKQDASCILKGETKSFVKSSWTIQTTLSSDGQTVTITTSPNSGAVNDPILLFGKFE